MTQGIDVATPQFGLSFATVVGAGVSFTAVKAGGANVGTYTAPHYAAQIDAARKAGLHIAHYWITGKGSATTQANYFSAHLHAFGSRDVLVLDNETLDSTGETWFDAKTAEFVARVLKVTGIAPDRFWLYGSAAMFRTHAWPATKKLGIRIWVASYGANDGTRTAPIIGTAFPAWHVHQYTSYGHIGGYTVDRNYSPLDIDALFPTAQVPVVAPAVVVPPPEEENTVPTFYKEKSSASIYSISWPTGKKYHLSAKQWKVAKAGPHTLVVVPDGALAAFA